ncbi:MAG: hypothetical protein GWO41_00965 [candidate division Zixibacteria bacterium]|nr:hypothetical protein [candidate division Zixibacteria bacterium]NIR66673.1 hypothetical protein [candidate division Zixibacteria bacterium]NIS14806.1 hypothetical protein [candidate division Zixibacteria bacterium]NIS48207.1 hypothetical protein [candidate division Zixibacteria bacterium]NIT51351.1 hypothetical protein [candidate division Zixibacteria bacterium]
MGVLVTRLKIFTVASLLIMIISGTITAEVNRDCLLARSSLINPTGGGRKAVIFGTFAESEHGLQNALVLAESIRTFAGKYQDAPVWVYVSQYTPEISDGLKARFAELGVKIKNSRTPEDAMGFYYSSKVFASALAEKEAEGLGRILVWMDNDTVILSEPSEFILSSGIDFGYKPVMHKLIASSYTEPPDAFWARIYEMLGVAESSLFPMMTVTDSIEIRPYFNAGVLIVRPEREILRKWAEYYPILYRDEYFQNLAESDNRIKIFLHQVALVGAVLNNVEEKEMSELSDSVNYPIFFKEMFGADHEYDDLNGVVTLRYDYYFRNPAPDWQKKLRGPEEIISWLSDKLGQ